MVQKTRNLRDHMRLWRAPVNLNDAPVWVEQPSRNIGVRLTIKTITTHKIDPDVDVARWYLMQDMFYSERSPPLSAATKSSSTKRRTASRRASRG